MLCSHPCSDILVPVAVLDINDNDPVFIFSTNASRYEARLRENSPFSRPIQFFASDADSGTNAQIVFSFTDASGKFTVHFRLLLTLLFML